MFNPKTRYVTRGVAADVPIIPVGDRADAQCGRDGVRRELLALRRRRSHRMGKRIVKKF